MFSASNFFAVTAVAASLLVKPGLTSAPDQAPHGSPAPKQSGATNDDGTMRWIITVSVVLSAVFLSAVAIIAVHTCCHGHDRDRRSSVTTVNEFPIAFPLGSQDEGVVVMGEPAGMAALRAAMRHTFVDVSDSDYEMPNSVPPSGEFFLDLDMTEGVVVSATTVTASFDQDEDDTTVSDAIQMSISPASPRGYAQRDL
jgi:hypothetical protein